MATSLNLSQLSRRSALVGVAAAPVGCVDATFRRARNKAHYRCGADGPRRGHRISDVYRTRVNIFISSSLWLALIFKLFASPFMVVIIRRAWVKRGAKSAGCASRNCDGTHWISSAWAMQRLRVRAGGRSGCATHKSTPH